MSIAKVIKVNAESIEFDNGANLASYHQEDCCENHYLSFNDLALDDFEGLEFDLSNDNFFKRIDGYGIELIPIVGHSLKVPGYGSNNGYYSDKLDLILSIKGEPDRVFDVTECQVVSG